MNPHSLGMLCFVENRRASKGKQAVARQACMCVCVSESVHGCTCVLWPVASVASYYTLCVCVCERERDIEFISKLVV